MKKRPGLKWRKAAWNGVCFVVPQSWRPVQIDALHLVFADNEVPCMEIRWQPVRGIFNPQKNLNKFIRHARRGSKAHVEQAVLPPAWTEAAAPCESHGFSWDREDQAGRGALLYCNQCRTATMIQFFLPFDENIPPKILASFQDHGFGATLPFTLFDIEAQIPKGSEIIAHRFLPGAFTLGFKKDSFTIEFQRFGPATALLGKNDLNAWAARTLAWPPVSPRAREVELSESIEPGEMETLQWLKPPQSWLHRRIGAGAKWNFFFRRVWHLPRKNRIMVCSIHGPRLWDGPSPENLAREFVIVDA